MKKGFVLHHNGPETHLDGKPHDRCVSYWEGIRDYHMRPEAEGGKGWSDIAYSWMACHHGLRLEGRGWFKNQFANGKDVVGPYDGDDTQWYTILAPIGWVPTTGAEEQPSPQMLQCIHGLIAEGRARELCGLSVLPHNAFKIKKCPGTVLTNLANSWNGKSLVLPGNILEEDMPYYTLYGAPDKPPRMYVDGAVIGFANQAELDEQAAAYDRAGYERKSVVFREADEYDRFMNGHFLRLTDINKRLIAIESKIGAPTPVNVDTDALAAALKPEIKAAVDEELDQIAD